MLPTKFGVNWPFGSGEEAKIRFSKWRSWRPSWIFNRKDFSYFWSTSHLDASCQVSNQLAQGCSGLLKQLLTPHDGRHTTDDGHWLTTIANHEHFVLRWAKTYLSDMCARRRFRSACAFALSDQNLHWVHFGSKGCKGSLCGQRRLRSDCANAQSDLSLRRTHMPKGTCSNVAAQYKLTDKIAFKIVLQGHPHLP